MEKIDWKVEGITCANCALSINKALTGQGMQKVAVNVITGDVSFETEDSNGSLSKAKSKIEGLGYTVHASNNANTGAKPARKYSKPLLRFWITLPFTLVLMLHMIPGLHLHWLMQPWVQFGLALPVFVIGMEYFGKSAWNSLKSGVPNMNVLIAMGAIAAFGYSCYGMFTNSPADFLFFETAASIITIVFFGYWLEDISVARTQKEIRKISRTQKVTANMIAYDDKHEEHVFPIDNQQLKVGDLVLIKTGEQVPMDCKILWGDAEVNEAILSGESVPVLKKQGDILIGGSVLVNGTVKAYVSAVGGNTVMSSIVTMMEKAQTQKPPVQKLADRISAVFVPAVLVVALLTLLGNMVLGGHSFQESLIRSVAVLVIACPCAMGLATPAAIAVGLGRAAKNGILFTDITRMESFKNIQQIIFDKTGTLTTGQFSISAFEVLDKEISMDEFRKIVFSLEKFSNHPIAKSVSAAWKTSGFLKWKTIKEIKGLGIQAETKEGIQFAIGSSQIIPGINDKSHQLYVAKNNELIGWLDIADEIRPEAREVVSFFKEKNIKTILLSGDTLAHCQPVADFLGIEEIFAGQSPQQKLEKIEALSNAGSTVMVGDGVNDAPALARATISVSLAEASQLAIQSASVVLTKKGLSSLPEAMLIGRQTYNTIKGNLFWAFIYNIVAIPVAALGYLHPTFGALIMGGSDVVLAINSLWLGVKKLS